MAALLQCDLISLKELKGFWVLLSVEAMLSALFHFYNWVLKVGQFAKSTTMGEINITHQLYNF